MSDTITLPKNEYQSLKDIKRKYEAIREMIGVDLFDQPGTRDAKKVIHDFRAAGLYTEDFLNSLERGLKESSYFSKRLSKR